MGLASIVRAVGALGLAEEVRYAVHLSRNASANREFRAENRAPMPPPRLLYEIQGSTHYPSYWSGGEQAAARIDALARRHLGGSSQIICEWGCGVARNVRHLPQYGHRVIGTDYDGRMIEWARRVIPDVEFHVNALAPPLSLNTAAVDCLFAVSVLTHLDADLHERWIEEIRRVVRPGGLIVLTTMGEGLKGRLGAGDRARYDAGELVTFKAKRIGSRLFGAYQSPAFMRRLLGTARVVEYLPGESNCQDMWVALNE